VRYEPAIHFVTTWSPTTQGRWVAGISNLTVITFLNDASIEKLNPFVGVKK